MNCPNCGGTLQPAKGIFLKCQCGYWCYDTTKFDTGKYKVSQNILDRTYRCKRCHKIFKSEKKLLKHENKHMPPKEIVYSHFVLSDTNLVVSNSNMSKRKIRKIDITYPVFIDIKMRNGVVQTYVRLDSPSCDTQNAIITKEEKKVKKHGIRNLFNLQFTTRKGER